MKTLTLILPAFNEAENIAATVKSAYETLSQLALEWEIIIVNDGSSDNTNKICSQLANADSRVRVIHHATNRGYGAALKSGIISARHQLGILLGIHIRDIDCAYKVFRREVFERIQIRSVGAMVNTEILAQAKKLGMRLKEVEVSHFPRRFGRPAGAKIGVIFKALRELVKLWCKLRFTHMDQEGIFAQPSRPRRDCLKSSK